MVNTQLSEETKKIFQNFGKQGGEATKRKYGTKHFSAAGKLGMAKRWGTRRKSQQLTRTQQV